MYPQLIYRLIFLLFGLYQGDLVDVENDLANADEQFEEGESKDAATEVVLSSRDMSELDSMLDANKVLYHHALLLRPTNILTAALGANTLSSYYHPTIIVTAALGAHSYIIL